METENERKMVRCLGMMLDTVQRLVVYEDAKAAREHFEKTKEMFFKAFLPDVKRPGDKQ
jgi:hypothetical protein